MIIDRAYRIADLKVAPKLTFIQYFIFERVTFSRKQNDHFSPEMIFMICSLIIGRNGKKFHILHL